MEEKTVAKSRVIHTDLIMPEDGNRHGTLYGGALMYKMDKVAAVSFSRHTGEIGMTASVDRLNFIRPLPIDHALTIESVVSGTGKSSVEVFVKVVGEDLSRGERYLAATAFFTFVVLKDAEGNRRTVAQIIGETAEEKNLLTAYPKRRARRLALREEEDIFQRTLTLD